MISKGIYSATCSVLNNDYSLNVQSTIDHAASSINQGLHGCIFFGSTGQSQLIDLSSKNKLVAEISSHKLRKNFFLGTGCNSLSETLDLIKYSMEYGFNDFLVMPPAYYKNNTEQGVYNFYKYLVNESPKVRIILYNFEKLSSFLFTPKFVNELVKNFPKNIIGVKDSSGNLFENLKIKDFLIFPGTEAKLLKSLELGNAGIISAITQVTHSLARKVFDDFFKKNEQTVNKKLIAVRETFDQYDLIAALHSFFSKKNKNFDNLLPPLTPLNQKEKKDLEKKLNSLKFSSEENLAA